MWIKKAIQFKSYCAGIYCAMFLSFFALLFVSPASWGITPAESAVALAKLGNEAKNTPASSKADVVNVGIYLNDVQSIDLKLHNYMVDFYIWFRWSDPDINPASSMEFVNHSDSWSTIMTDGYENPEKMPDGSLYQVKHVQGKMSRKMNLQNYPFDKQIIEVVIEDAVSESSKMKYVIDKVSVNKDLKLPGFLYSAPTLIAQNYTHQTDFGDSRNPEGTYSRITLALPIERPHLNAFLKNILPIMLAVICCSMVFLLHPSLVDSRFQIAVIALLSIVGLQMSSSQDLPTIEYMTLLDNLYVIGYFFCIFAVVALTISTKIAHIHDGESDPKGMKRAIRFDRIAGLLFLIGYLGLTLYTMRPMFV